MPITKSNLDYAKEIIPILGTRMRLTPKMVESVLEEIQDGLMRGMGESEIIHNPGVEIRIRENRFDKQGKKGISLKKER